MKCKIKDGQDFFVIIHICSKQLYTNTCIFIGWDSVVKTLAVVIAEQQTQLIQQKKCSSYTFN